MNTEKPLQKGDGPSISMNNGGAAGKDWKKGLAWAVRAWWARVAAGLVAHALGWAFPGASFGDALLLVPLMAYWAPLAIGVLVWLARMAAGCVRELRHREWRRAGLKLATLGGLVAAGAALMNIPVREPMPLVVALFAVGAVCAFVAVAYTVVHALKGLLSAGSQRKPAP